MGPRNPVGRAAGATWWMPGGRLLGAEPTVQVPASLGFLTWGLPLQVWPGRPDVYRSWCIGLEVG